MYYLILTTLMLTNDQLVVKDNIIPEPYKTMEQCQLVIKMAQDHINKVAKESNTVPGIVSCKRIEGV